MRKAQRLSVFTRDEVSPAIREWPAVYSPLPPTPTRTSAESRTQAYVTEPMVTPCKGRTAPSSGPQRHASGHDPHGDGRHPAKPLAECPRLGRGRQTKPLRSPELVSKYLDPVPDRTDDRKQRSSTNSRCKSAVAREHIMRYALNRSRQCLAPMMALRQPF